MIPEIRIDEFSYSLPEERIAKYPLEERDKSKLLIYDGALISEDVFRNLPSHLPSGALMVFNDTKVIPARLLFKRASGARIEILCLEPVSPTEYTLVFSETESCRWKCVVGNSKRWKGDCLSLDIPGCDDIALKAKLIERQDAFVIVEFTWNGGIPFSKVLEKCGQMPIPPYLNRKSEAVDSERYQTLYARTNGSVAAPTAGLHFTEKVLSDLSSAGIDKEHICLHVGAGTFLPVKSNYISGHAMHGEPFTVSLSLLEKIRDGKLTVAAVGTTSVRTLESLYYIGVSCIEQGEPSDVKQWAPYIREYSYSTKEALSGLIFYLEKHNLTEISASTHIMIVPGFKFRIVDILVTNFHQPESTLILLVSAFIGNGWRRVYEYALEHDFRFLSYGDSNLLFRKK